MESEIKKIWDDFCCELRNFIKHRVNDDLLIDDILQEVFIKIHKNIDTLRDQTKLKSWIYQITRNTIIDNLRSLKIFSNDFPSVDFYENIDEQGPVNEIANSIIILAENLPAIYSEAFIETEINGLSQKAFASKINISLSGAKSRIQRARQMIRDELMKCCHYEFDKYGKLVDYKPHSCCCCS